MCIILGLKANLRFCTIRQDDEVLEKEEKRLPLEAITSCVLIVCLKEDLLK